MIDYKWGKREVELSCSVQWSEFAWQSQATNYKLNTHLKFCSLYKAIASFNAKLLVSFLNEIEFFATDIVFY